MDDYRAGDPRAARFFSGSPTDLRAFASKLDEVRTRFGRREREMAAAAVRPTSPGAAARLARFVDEGGAMVTTGQQAGLFTGPLYTIHKALTAIRLAQALEEALGTVVLPLFWCASEDHDFAEANHAFVPGGAGELRRLSVAPTDPRPLAMSEMRLGEDVESVTRVLLESIAEFGDNGVHLRSIPAAYRGGETVGGAFRETMVRLFAGFDLLVADAADPALKAASLPVLLGEAERAAGHEALLRERTEALESAGYAGQVTVMPRATNLFFHGPDGRERLVRAGGGFAAERARIRFTPDELAAAVRAEPGAFSPNVFLRPVVESAVFPTLAYVGGPAEVAYFAQVQPLFASFGIRPPIACPRLSVRLVPDDVAEQARALGVTDEELRLPEHELVARVARRRLPADVSDRLASLRAALVEGFGAVMDASGPIDANLAPAIGARRDRAMLAVADAERKVLLHWKKRDPGLVHDLPRVRTWLAPLGQPQERVLNVFPFLAMRPTLLEDVAARMEIGFGDGAGGALHAPAPAGAAAAAPGA